MGTFSYICMVLVFGVSLCFIPLRSFLNNCRIGTQIFALICLIILCSLPLFTCYFGIDYTDTFFHLAAIQQKQYDNYVLSFGTIAIAHPMLRLFSFSVFASRILGKYIYIASSLLPIIVYVSVHRDKYSVESIMAATAAVLCLTCKSATFVSYDLLGNLFLSGMLSILHYREQRPNSNISMFLLALCSALSVSCRLPNAIACVGVALYIFFKSVSSQSIKDSFREVIIYSSITLAIFCIEVLCCYGSLQSYLYFVKKVLFESSYLGTEHSMRYMCSSILANMHILVFYLSIVCVFFAATSDVSNKKKVFLGALYVGYAIYLQKLNYDAYGWHYSIYLSSLLCVLLVYLFLNNHRWESIAIGILFIVPIIGSDTGLLKLGCSFCLPIVVWISSVEYNKSYFATIVMSVLLLLLPYRWKHSTYEDAGIGSLSKTFTSIPQFSRINSTTERVCDIEEIYNYIESKKKDGCEVVCVGDRDYLFEYACALNSPFNHAWQVSLNDQNLVSSIQKYLCDINIESVSFVLTCSKDDGVTKVEQLLNEKNCEYKKYICR